MTDNAPTESRWQAQLLETALMSVSRGIRRVHDTSLKQFELNLTEANILVMIQELGPLPQTQLARRYGVGRARAGSVVDHLEKLGFVERVADPGDRRVWLVKATGSGNKMAAKIMDNAEILEADLRRGLSAQEEQQLMKLLSRLLVNLHSMDSTGTLEAAS